MIRGVRTRGHPGLLVILLSAAALVATGADASARDGVTEARIEENSASYQMSFVYPQIGRSSADAEIEAWAQSLIDDFRGALAHKTGSEPPYFAQLSYGIGRDDDSMVSILFTYSDYLGGAHGLQTQTAFNYLMPDAVRVFLPDLIGSAGVNRVSEFATADLDRQLAATSQFERDWIARGAGPYAENFDTFEWLPDEVVLHFDPYSVASYANGPQEVHVPVATLQDVMRPDPRAPLPSFDCAAASTPVERAICSDFGLAQLDRRTAEAYAMRLRFEALGGVQPKVQAEQVAWLAQRDADCGDQADAGQVACLKDEYTARLRRLRRFE